MNARQRATETATYLLYRFMSWLGPILPTRSGRSAYESAGRRFYRLLSGARATVAASCSCSASSSSIRLLTTSPMLTMPASRPASRTGMCRTRFLVINTLRLSRVSPGAQVATDAKGCEAVYQ